MQSSHSNGFNWNDTEKEVFFGWSFMPRHFYKHLIWINLIDPEHLQGLTKGLSYSGVSPKQILQEAAPNYILTLNTILILLLFGLKLLALGIWIFFNMNILQLIMVKDFIHFDLEIEV